MNKTAYIVVIVLLSLVTLALLVKCCLPPANPVVAHFSGENITQSQWLEQLKERYGASVLDDMITERIVEKAVASQKITVSEEELKLWVADYIKRPDAQELVYSQQLDKDKLLGNLRTSVPLYYLALKKVTEPERQKYFNEHKKSFEELELKHILLGSEEEALELRPRINGEDSFSAMATVHSLDEKSRDIGGSLGRVTYMELESSFDPLSVKELFSQKVGSISMPMASSSGGWHLFYVKSRTTDYQSLKRRVIESMAQQRLQKCLEELRDQAKVQIMIEGDSKKHPENKGNLPDQKPGQVSSQKEEQKQ